ncbi:glycosyltransferase family 2 protein [Acetobacter tropicalis]|nr:glycosyltransferase family 2 protein [Acetobacter tropicalis]
MTTCIVACAANENKYINEWISYHLRLGFDKIYLYCNDIDPEPLYKTVLPWIDLGCVIFNHHPVPGEQNVMYMHYLHVYRMHDEWVSFLDVDEFFSIKEFLRKRENTDCIYFNWLRFGPNGYQETPSGLVLENYTRREKIVDSTFKIILKTSAIDLQFMVDNRCPFQHGLGAGDWFFNPFNRNENFKGRNVLGDNMREVLENPESYCLKKSEQILWSATVAHFYLKSIDHYRQRSLRGKDLGPGWELDWTRKFESGEYKKEIEKVSEVHDEWLSMRNKELKVFRRFSPNIVF